MLVLERKLTIQEKSILNEALMHGRRVAKLTYKLSKMMGLDEKDCIYNYLAALYHDIGKCRISPDIILKPGKLTNSEYEKVKEHPVFSYRMLFDKGIDKRICLAVKHHHESRSGNGYPDGLIGESIPLSSRIIKVCDVYDALISDRPYRKAMTKCQAVKIMENNKTEFDENILKLFMCGKP